MYLFIDTNIYLSFYHFNKDDITELYKLHKMIEAREITLLITDQVINEYYRNREKKINDAIKQIRDIKQDFPRFIVDYKEYLELRDIYKNYSSKYEELMDKVATDISSNTLAADRIITDLITVAKQLNHQKVHLEKAKERISVGNPPGKNGSLGDAINWEILLDFAYDEYEEIHFVSIDKDYGSILDDNKINEYLEREWSNKVKNKLYYYDRLSSFFKKNYPVIEFNENIDRQIDVSKLCNSQNYRDTHKAISKLNTYVTFSTKDVTRILEALQNNSQINGIIEDHDIFWFYQTIWMKYIKDVNNEIKSKIEPLLRQVDEYFDDIPF